MKKFRGSLFSNLVVLNLMIGLSISLFALSSYATTPPIHEQSRCLVKPNQEARNVNTNKVLGQDTNEGGYGTCYLVDNDYVIQLQGGRRFKVNKSAVTEVIPLNKLQTPNPLVERFNGLKNRIFGSKVEEPTQKPTSNEDFSYSGLVKIRTVRPLSPQEAAAKSTPTQPATSPVIEPASRPTTAVTQNETINEDLESKRINILESVGRVAVKSNPNLTSTFECPEGINPALCDKAKTINHSTPLTLTGREQEDRDNKINYVEASYEIENHDFVGWFDKKQTTLDPHQQQVRTQTAITSSEKKEWNQYNEIRGSVSSISVEEAEKNGGAEIKKTFRRLQGLDESDSSKITVTSKNESFSPPICGCNGQCRITSGFGPRKPFRTVNGSWSSSNHPGWDIGSRGQSNINVTSVGYGKVIQSKRVSGYGYQVVVDYGDGLKVYYSHLRKGSLTKKVGDEVNPGDKLGVMGMTGNSTGIHLDIIFRVNGKATNPSEFISSSASSLNNSCGS